MKSMAAWAVAVATASLASSPASAVITCDYGSQAVFTFVKWEFERRSADSIELKLTYRNNLKQPFARVELRMLVDDAEAGYARIISMNKRQSIPAIGDGVLNATYAGMPDSDATKFGAATPLICVMVLEDDKGSRKRFDPD